MRIDLDLYSKRHTWAFDSKKRPRCEDCGADGAREGQVRADCPGKQLTDGEWLIKEIIE